MLQRTEDLNDAQQRALALSEADSRGSPRTAGGSPSLDGVRKEERRLDGVVREVWRDSVS
jgi:hypothetical protein